MLQPIKMDLEGATLVHGGLYDTDDPAVLDEDMLLVCVGERCVDVGWYGDGQYGVCEYVGTFHNQQEWHRLQSVHAVVKLVESIVRHYREAAS